MQTAWHEKGKTHSHGTRDIEEGFLSLLQGDPLEIQQRFPMHWKALKFGGLRLVRFLGKLLSDPESSSLAVLLNVMSHAKAGGRISSIMGPPGAGKTYASNSLVLCLLAFSSAKVVWTSLQNKALRYAAMDIDAVIDTDVFCEGRWLAARIPSRSIAAKEGPTGLDNEGGGGEINLNSARLIVATCGKLLTHKAFKDYDAIITIFDESQMARTPEALAVAARYMEHYLLLVGDPRQSSGAAVSWAQVQLFLYLDVNTRPLMRSPLIRANRVVGIPAAESILLAAGGVITLLDVLATPPGDRFQFSIEKDGNYKVTFSRNRSLDDIIDAAANSEDALFLVRHVIQVADHFAAIRAEAQGQPSLVRDSEGAAAASLTPTTKSSLAAALRNALRATNSEQLASLPVTPPTSTAEQEARERAIIATYVSVSTS